MPIGKKKKLMIERKKGNTFVQEIYEDKNPNYIEYPIEKDYVFETALETNLFMQDYISENALTIGEYVNVQNLEKFLGKFLKNKN